MSRDRDSSHGRMHRWWVMAVMVVGVIVPALGDWTAACPQSCQCTYVSNRKVAKCEASGYSTVPGNASPEIQELVLADNLIRQLDAREFSKVGLVNLQKLDVSSNQISYVDKDAFFGLHILTHLNLDHNRVDKLHLSTFSNMEKLRELDLSNNELSRLEAKQFPSLPHLQKLKLNNNDINFINNLAFANLPNITTIELAGNKLQRVDAALFASSPRLVALELGNNAWHCDCRMREFARWMLASNVFRNTNWNCFSPDRLQNIHWADVPLEDYACDPVIRTSKDIVPVSVGLHATLECWAQGDPTPSLKWVAERKVLSNMTTIGETSDHYAVITLQNSTGVHSTLDLGIYGTAHPTTYKCIATNPATSVERTIEVVVGSADQLDEAVTAGPQLWVLITVGAVLIVLLILLIILVIGCCLCRRRQATPRDKSNGPDNGNIMIVPPSSTVNPIVKPMRQYEKLPQNDIEMTNVTHSQDKSFDDELNYSTNNRSIYVDRSRLPAVVEEGAIMGLYSSLPYHVPQAPSPSFTIQSNMTQTTTTAQYPDILDNVGVPRTISPTQVSYQSLAYPTLAPDWRFSYAHPMDYNGTEYAPEFSRSPVSYSTPQHQRPGYVTLPRRPRAPSWSGVPRGNPLIVPNPLLSTASPTRYAIYDTLGPRTTADGTSTTDLTRPGSRAALYEPLPPVGTLSPTSPSALAAHYTIMAAQKPTRRAGASQTLPRSTPNLLDDSLRSHRRRPVDVHSPLGKASEIEPLIEDPNLGIPYEPSLNCTSDDDVFSPGLEGNLNNNNNNFKNNFNSAKSGTTSNNTHNPERVDEALLTPLAASPSHSNKSSNRTLNSSMSPSPVPTPTQILSSADKAPVDDMKHPLDTFSPSISSKNLPTGTNGYSSAGSMSSGFSESRSPISPTLMSGDNYGPPKKKVPPKPPPKPSKRLSVASTSSDASLVARQSSIQYEDNGLDGSEV